MANDKQELERKNELLCLAIEHQRDELERVRGLLQRILDSDYTDDEGRCMVCQWRRHSKDCPIGLAESEPSAETGGEKAKEGLVQLNEAQKAAIADWGADDRLWRSQETVTFNLEVFARKIVALAESSLSSQPPTMDDPELVEFALNEQAASPESSPCVHCGQQVSPERDFSIVRLHESGECV